MNLFDDHTTVPCAECGRQHPDADLVDIWLPAGRTLHPTCPDCTAAVLARQTAEHQT